MNNTLVISPAICGIEALPENLQYWSTWGPSTSSGWQTWL